MTAAMKPFPGTLLYPVGGPGTPPDADLRTAWPNKTFRHITAWSRDLQQALETIEQCAFSPDLRYTFDEMVERAARPGFEGLLVSDGEGPAAIVLVYQLDDDASDSRGTLYLDTLAVRDRGRGMGTRLLTFLIRRSTDAGLSRIVLDTEGAASELPGYYRRFGFRPVRTERRSGNVTMELSLPPPGSSGR